MHTLVDLHFVMPGASQLTLAADPDYDWRSFGRSEPAWSLQSAIFLARAGARVTLDSTPREDAINFIPASMMMGRRLGSERCYTVSLAADKTLIPWAHAHVVQNASQRGFNRYWLHHWPQPGLIPRDPERGCNVKTVGFAGLPVNSGLSDGALASVCKSFGLSFRQLSPSDWNDYSNVDVLVGVRDFAGGRYPRKPASKLLNAWLANTPFIGGVDSAYEQVGKPGVNYLQVRTLDQFEKALERLVTDAALYNSLTSHGRAASEICCRQAIVVSWMRVAELLESDFLRWRRSSMAVRATGAVIRGTRVRLERLRFPGVGR
ncbi:MAG: hypothetical protein LPK15_06355 [Alteromonadaceae bacterium]|nr:hypothetical protein [Marinobacter sp.]MDX5440054.1 hypothetical protein [Alteromonadaceae bacterium]